MIISRAYRRRRRKGSVALEEIIVKAAFVAAILAVVGGVQGKVSGLMGTIIGAMP